MLTERVCVCRSANTISILCNTNVYNLITCSVFMKLILSCNRNSLGITMSWRIVWKNWSCLPMYTFNASGFRDFQHAYMNRYVTTWLFLLNRATKYQRRTTRIESETNKFVSRLKTRLLNINLIFKRYPKTKTAYKRYCFSFTYTVFV